MLESVVEQCRDTFLLPNVVNDDSETSDVLHLSQPNILPAELVDNGCRRLGGTARKVEVEFMLKQVDDGIIGRSKRAPIVV